MKKLTLSFDNGPSLSVTPYVLDVLAQNSLKTTFFVCGKEIVAAPQRALLQRAKEEGHWLGNHTFSHTIQLGQSRDPQLPHQEIGRTQELLAEFAGSNRLFRPYGGGGIISQKLLSPHAVTYLCREKFTCVLWNSVPRDWEDTQGWPERALQDIENQAWTLVVLHDLPTGAMQQLPRFLNLVHQANVEIIQSFPDDCLPIYQGQIMGSIDHLVTSD